MHTYPDRHTKTHTETHKDTWTETQFIQTLIAHTEAMHMHTQRHMNTKAEAHVHRDTHAHRDNSHRDTLCRHRGTCMRAHRETLTCTSTFLDCSTTSSHIYPLGVCVPNTQSSKGERTEADPRLQLQVRVLLKTRVLEGAEDTQATAAEL